ncbi:MAG TPA: UDP-3-O-acyl-N-acetylglucosamine deacetylase, partial [Bdellovibrionales bacterium]|nr:UDP-3-O-acyl-N-acetylglucosamine deacetylase [Bdellovibrionales bacterium]
MFLQRTIKKPVAVKGVGLHTGQPATLTFRPAPADTGVHFVRSDLPGRPSLAARAENISATSFATTLAGPEFSVSTVEHCLSALAVLRIDNLVVELDGPEIPICDGSAWHFWDVLKNVGLVDQEQPRKYMFVTQPIYFGDDEKHAYVVPYNGLRVTCTIDFTHPQIGRQVLDLDVNPHSFETNLAKARTFGFMKDVEAMQAKGLARGGSLDNCIVLNDAGVMNAEGLRYPDEFVRHKMMDALGDLVTLGHPLMGHVVLFKAGH